MNPTGLTSQNLDALVAEFVDRLKRGEQPSIEEFAADHPQLADQIRELLPTIQCLEGLKHVAGNDPLTGAQLDDFRIVREIGRGGMGIVYEALQVSLARRVALKVLSGERSKSRVLVDRFRREARSMAALHHTNIVPVFGVGEAGGVSYFAMQYIEGRGLDEVLRELSRLRGMAGPDEVPGSEDGARPAGPSLVASISKQFYAIDPNRPRACDQHEASAPESRSEPAHEQQLVADETRAPGSTATRLAARIRAQRGTHGPKSRRRAGLCASPRRFAPRRQALEPARPVDGTVWVTDFGLAKVQDSDQLTETGDIVGTLRYMAPERFEGKSLPQSDIYSLGLTLYEMLTLEAPVREIDRAGLIHKIMHEPIAPPRQLDDRIPRDLETIVLKAIARDPADRYSSADELAADLERFLNDEPIRARPLGATERLWRWARRNPGIASLTATVLLLLTTLALGSTFAAVRISAARTLAEANLGQAQQAESDATLAAEHAEREAKTANAVSELLVSLFFVTSPESRMAGLAGRFFDRNTPDNPLTARNLLDRAAMYIPTDLADQPEVQVALSLTIGRAYYGLGDSDRAHRILEEALTVSRRIHSGPHSSQAEALRWMAMVSAPEEAARCNREAREIWRALGQQDNYAYQLPRFASSLMWLGKEVEAEAEENFREGIRLMEKMPPERQIYLADALTHFALLLERQNHFAEALPLKRRAVELALVHRGVAHPDTIFIQRDLINSLVRDKLYSEAIKVEQDLLTGIQTNWGPTHVEVAPGHLRLSGYWLAAGAADQAAREARECIAVARQFHLRWESLMWQAHGQVALIKALVRQKLLAEADRVAGEVTAARLEFHAIANEEACALALLVRKQLAAGDRDGCRAACRRLVELANTAERERVPLFVIDACCQAPDLLDNPAELLPLFERAYKVVPDESQWLALKGAILYRSGEFKKASDLLGTFCIAAGHFGTSYERFFLAMAHARQGKLQPAQRWLESGLDWLAANAPSPDASDAPDRDAATPGLGPTDPAGFWVELRLLAAETQAVVAEAAR
jgi:tetratricopeptide (TPR) repeat protein